jgi:iron complex outermembrane receptor protein
MYQNNNPNSATEFIIPNFNLLDVGAFAFLKKSFKRVDLLGGCRYDVRSFSNQELFSATNSSTGFDEIVSAQNSSQTNFQKVFDKFSTTFSGWSGSVGMAYNINQHFTLKANVARGFRAPNVAEISSQGIHPGTGFFQSGSENLKSEFSLQQDLGLFFENHHIDASVEIFNNNISNYIFNQKLQTAKNIDSLVFHGSDKFPVFQFKQTTAHLFGGEFDIEIHPHPLDWLHFENTISGVYAINEGGNGAMINDSNKYLPFIPPIHTNSELRAEFKKQYHRLKYVFVKVGVQYFAAQNRAFLAYNTETKTPSYTLFDAGIGTDFLNNKNKIIARITLLASNLTDVAYQSNMSRLKYMDSYPNNFTGRSGIYNMGRNVSVKLIVPIQ